MCGHKIREFESIYQKRKSIFFVPHRQKGAILWMAPFFRLFRFGGRRQQHLKEIF